MQTNVEYPSNLTVIFQKFFLLNKSGDCSPAIKNVVLMLLNS